MHLPPHRIHAAIQASKQPIKDLESDMSWPTSAPSLDSVVGRTAQGAPYVKTEYSAHAPLGTRGTVRTILPEVGFEHVPVRPRDGRFAHEEPKDVYRRRIGNDILQLTIHYTDQTY